MDLLVHPVHAVRHHVVDVHGPGFAVAQSTTRHHHYLQGKVVTRDSQSLLQIGQVRNDHPLARVLRLLHSLDRVIRHRSLVVGVSQNRLERAQDGDLIAPADAVGLQLLQETLHHDGSYGYQLP
ncbi:hypothetical protein [Streptomyces sp. NPDC058847]|uniref:hypothetical protein n=1 Tax=Streptomyces sp. NPDC058847 TaxID=3346649 RepID=UPI0036815178